MTRIDNDIFKTLKGESFLDAVIIDQMDLAPEQFATVSTVLQALNWLKAVAKEEGVPIEQIDRKVVIRRILGRELSGKEVERALKLLAERSQKHR